MGLTGIDTDANLQAATNTKWEDQRLEYSTGDLIYKGAHEKHNAGTDDSDWFIWKFTWSGSDIIRIELRKGPWDDRATLGWG